MIGDFLVLFGNDAPPNTGRSVERGWKVLPHLPHSWTQPSSPAWRGYPFEEINSADWQVLILGESNGWQLSTPHDVEDLSAQVSRLTGSFLIFAFHPTTQTWHAWTDRFGTLHAYHAWDGRRAALGTFSPAVAAAASQRKLDWEALTAWFAFGFFPADRTYFTDVHILRPASHYAFDREGRLLRQERYWQWQHHPDRDRSYEETVSAFGDVFGAVMSDALAEGNVVLPLSGGLDSRSTLSEVTPEIAASGRLWAYSYGYSDHSVETKIARQLAAARRLPFQAYTIRPYLFDKIESLLAYTEGFQDITQARQMFVREEIAGHADTLIAALWGDVWLDDMGLIDVADADDRQILHHTLKKITRPSRWLLETLALPQLRLPSERPLLECFVRSELESLAHLAEPDFRVKAFKTEQWSFRWSIPPTRVFQSAAWPRKVFYDTRLADFFATVPGSFLVGRKLQIDYLKRFAPDLARILWQVYDTDLFHYQHFNTWLLPLRALKKAWRVLSQQPIIERNWEVQFLCPSGRRGLDDWLLRPGLKLHDLVSLDALRKLLDAFYMAPLRSGEATSLSMLLTFSAWLEAYG